MKKWIISGILVALAILFACLKSVWTGFVYFGIVCLSALCLFWIYVRIKLYIKVYHTDFNKQFIGYKADYINTYNIREEDFENILTSHVKEFKKLLRREKIVDIFKILFIMSVFVVCIVAIIGL